MGELMEHTHVAMETRQPPPTAGGPTEMNMMSSEYHIPSEAELVLLSLDYLRDLRRAYAHKEDLLRAEGLDADWLTLAIFALNRSFSRKNGPKSLHLVNDAWKSETQPISCSIDRLPSIEKMTDEVVYNANPLVGPNSNANPNVNSNASVTGNRPDPQEYGTHATSTLNDPKDEDLDAFAWYEYDDSHPSNQYRYYPLNGLGGSNRGPLLLGEIAAAGLSHLQARTRREADLEIISSPLFEQFLQAVTSKGFFKDPENETPLSDPLRNQERIKRKEAVYQARFDKVVAKFRTKLAAKADPTSDNDTLSMADLQYTRRLRNCLAVREDRYHEPVPKPTTTTSRLPPGIPDPNDVHEAERLKNVGNAQMQRKDYAAAAAAYTEALKLSSSGPNSHVYYSNRAAALLSMKQFTDAISDSERSLALRPDYGKAHARLGLAHFLLGNYKQAVDAYTVALQYEPDNKSSRSYLEKATKRLAKQEDQTIMPGASFNVIGEWEKSQPPPSTVSHQASFMAQTPTAVAEDEQEAEKAKVQGNQLMAQRKYKEALEVYTKAIELSPNGSQTHVYYSNRAAALCYLERYEEAERDSLISLELKPDYGKAHARLGLSRFFMNDFQGAIEAYTAALQYDPNNAASKSYLAKAKLKWEQQRHVTNPVVNTDPTLGTEKDVRRLINDVELKSVGKRGVAPSPQSGPQPMEDSEMVRIARRTMNDPTMISAVKTAVNR